MQNVMTAKQFNAQFTGSVEIPARPQIFPLPAVEENFLNRVCPIHRIPMQNIQHPLKPLGVIMCQVCPECQKDLKEHSA